MVNMSKLTVGNTTKHVLTRNGYAYVLTGHHSKAAAELVELENLTEVQLSAAISAEDYEDSPLGISMWKEVPEEARKEYLESEKSEWCKMMQYMAFTMPAEEFWNEIRYAREHHNKFSEKFDPKNRAVNADDMYCSAIGRLTRRQFGEYSEIIILSTINSKNSKDTFVALINQYRTLLAKIIIDNKECFDIWSDEKIRDYLTKIER